MIEINIICDKCGEVIHTRKISQKFEDYVNLEVLGRRIISPIFEPSMIVGNKHLHYCLNCEEEVKKILKLEETK